MATFEGHTIVSCGTLSPELNHLQETGFLDADKILYTIPGLHENKHELKRHLLRQLDNASKYSSKVIVVYGEKCYIDTSTTPPRLVDDLVEMHEGKARRVRATNCIDMICSRKDRKRISGDQKAYWLTAGWVKYWKRIFKDWDDAKANETFPQNDKAVLLDPLGVYQDYVTNSPEKLLEFSDWMGIPIEPHEVDLERLKKLLTEQLQALQEG